ncbi:MAG: ribulose-phosphate 3-epimerase [archaeon]
MITQISVSILSLDYTDQTIIDQALMRVSTANYVHFDVMDGKFVKQKTFDHELVKNTNTGVLKKEVHLMVKEPEKVVDKYIKAGADMIAFHAEACKAPKKLIEKIKKKGVLVGLAIDPETPVKKIEKYLDDIDLVLVMTAHPGKAGQKLLKSTLKKIAALRKKKPNLTIEADCGINDKTASEVIDAGADILVSSSYIWGSKDPKLAIDLLRNC